MHSPTVDALDLAPQLRLKAAHATKARQLLAPERDKRLQAFEAEGRSGGAIAERLGTTRNAVLKRLQVLRGLHLTFKSYIEAVRALRAAAAPRRRERQRRRREAMARLRADIAKGVPQNVAIVSALRRGTTYQAIGDVTSVSKQRVQQIAVAHGIGRRKAT